MAHLKKCLTNVLQVAAAVGFVDHQEASLVKAFKVFDVVITQQ